MAFAATVSASQKTRPVLNAGKALLLNTGFSTLPVVKPGARVGQPVSAVHFCTGRVVAFRVVCSRIMLVRAAADTGASGPACAIAGVPSTGGCPELAVDHDLHVAGCFLESIGIEIVIINVHTPAHIFIFM